MQTGPPSSANGIDPLMHGDRYHTIRLLGQGTFGEVYECSDKRAAQQQQQQQQSQLLTTTSSPNSNTMSSPVMTSSSPATTTTNNTTSETRVAIKTSQDTEVYRNAMLREALILRQLRSLSEVPQIAMTFDRAQRIHLVMELMRGGNLYEYLAARRYAPVPVSLIRRALFRVLRVLQRLHKVLSYTHSDVKLENILFRKAESECSSQGELFDNIVLIDFGSARLGVQNRYYDIQSLWYRAPEVMCNIPYGPGIDVWSLGCVGFELLCAAPLTPADSVDDALRRIVRSVGKIPQSMAAKAGAKLPSELIEGSQQEENQEADEGPSLPRLLQNIQGCPVALEDLLLRMLQIDPEKRITVDAALEHDFFAESRRQLEQQQQQVSQQNNEADLDVDGPIVLPDDIVARGYAATEAAAAAAAADDNNAEGGENDDGNDEMLLSPEEEAALEKLEEYEEQQQNQQQRQQQQNESQSPASPASISSQDLNAALREVEAEKERERLLQLQLEQPQQREQQQTEEELLDLSIDIDDVIHDDNGDETAAVTQQQLQTKSQSSERDEAQQQRLIDRVHSSVNHASGVDQAERLQKLRLERERIDQQIAEMQRKLIPPPDRSTPSPPPIVDQEDEDDVPPPPPPPLPVPSTKSHQEVQPSTATSPSTAASSTAATTTTVGRNVVFTVPEPRFQEFETQPAAAAAAAALPVGHASAAHVVRAAALVTATAMATPAQLAAANRAAVAEEESARRRKQQDDDDDSFFPHAAAQRSNAVQGRDLINPRMSDWMLGPPNRNEVAAALKHQQQVKAKQQQQQQQSQSLSPPQLQQQQQTQPQPQPQQYFPFSDQHPRYQHLHYHAATSATTQSLFGFGGDLDPVAENNDYQTSPPRNPAKLVPPSSVHHQQNTQQRNNNVVPWPWSMAQQQAVTAQSQQHEQQQRYQQSHRNQQDFIQHQFQQHTASASAIPPSILGHYNHHHQSLSQGRVIMLQAGGTNNGYGNEPSPSSSPPPSGSSPPRGPTFFLRKFDTPPEELEDLIDDL